MQIFNFRDGNVTAFWHTSGIFDLPKCAWSQTLQTSKRHTFRVSAFHVLGVKLFPVGCAQDSRTVKGFPVKCEKCFFFDLALPALQNSGIFHDITRSQLHFDGLSPKSRPSVVSIYIGLMVRYKYYKNSRSG